LKLDAEREAALLAPVGPHAWLPAKPVRAPVVVAMAKPVGATAKAASRDAAAERLITAVCQKLIALEEPLNALDAKAGDGDTGSTVATGARSVLDRIDTLPLA
ncbi:dihydroxyacetone kinase, partial [Mesorhizobium sp. M4B.F.Ca.ET.215.01.1.1]